MPNEPEAEGLLSLMLFCDSRRDARRDSAGTYVPLSAQDVTRWSQPLIDEAEHLLLHASEAGRAGRLQLEGPSSQRMRSERQRARPTGSRSHCCMKD